MASGVRNSCDTMETKLLLSWLSSFPARAVLSNSALRLFSLGDVQGEGEDVRCVVEFDGFG